MFMQRKRIHGGSPIGKVSTKVFNGVRVFNEAHVSLRNVFQLFQCQRYIAEKGLPYP